MLVSDVVTAWMTRRPIRPVGAMGPALNVRSVAVQWLRQTSALGRLPVLASRKRTAACFLLQRSYRPGAHRSPKVLLLAEVEVKGIARVDEHLPFQIACCCIAMSHGVGPLAPLCSTALCLASVSLATGDSIVSSNGTLGALRDMCPSPSTFFAASCCAKGERSRCGRRPSTSWLS